MKPTLDACCGGRMMWHAKRDPNTVYMDMRVIERHVFYGKDRQFEVQPDVVGDFRAMPFPDDSFSSVVFDPPHVPGATSFMALKYGSLGEEWKSDISAGFRECFRVCEPGGLVIFKWSEVRVPWREVRPLAGRDPIFGQRGGRAGNTHWQVYRA